MEIRIRKATKADAPKIRKIDTFGRQLNSYSGMDKLDSSYKLKRGEKTYYEYSFTAKRNGVMWQKRVTKLRGLFYLILKTGNLGSE